MAHSLDFSLVGQLDGVDVHEGYIWDRDFKSIVAPVPAPSMRYFPVLHPQMFKQGQEILIESRLGDKANNIKPIRATIRAIEGAILILAHALPFKPTPGACVAVLRGEVSHFVDARESEKWAKEREKTRWI